MKIDRVKLIAEMARKNIAVIELAEKSGVSRVTISAIRSGKMCNTHTGTKLAEALGLNVDDLIEEV